MTPTETTGLVAAVYTIARTVEAGFKKVFGSLERKRKEDRRRHSEDRLAAQFEDIQRELKKHGVCLTKIGVRQEDMMRRIDSLEGDVRALTKLESSS